MVAVSTIYTEGQRIGNMQQIQSGELRTGTRVSVAKFKSDFTWKVVTEYPVDEITYGCTSCTA